MATSSLSAKLNLRNVCGALGGIGTKWFKIGIQLGIPHNKLLEFRESPDPLSAVIDFWLRGNVLECDISVSWVSIVTALRSKYVGEPGLAEEIRRDFCEQDQEMLPAAESMNPTAPAESSQELYTKPTPEKVTGPLSSSIPDEGSKTHPDVRMGPPSSSTPDGGSKTYPDVTMGPPSSSTSDGGSKTYPDVTMGPPSSSTSDGGSKTYPDVTMGPPSSFTPDGGSGTHPDVRMGPPSSFIPDEGSEMHPDIKMDLEFILTRNLKQIVNKYASYVDCLRAAVCEKGVTPKDLRVYLLSLPASSSNQLLTLLSDKKAELRECDSLADIFAFLTTECASFLNYDIFESIRSRYKVSDEEGILTTYSDSLKDFIRKHKISEFTKINPLLKHKKGSKELTLKYDIETTCNLAKVDELKKALAEIMDLNPSALEIVDIKDGCVIVTFLIPESVADALFTPDTVFTAQQEEDLRAKSVLWMKCNGHTYHFKAQKHKDQALQKLKEQLTCSICLGIYSNPKQLQCQHAFCQRCLMGLAQQDQQGGSTIICPTCRHITPVPVNGVVGLQADFRANQLLSIVGEDWEEPVGATPEGVKDSELKCAAETTSPVKNLDVSCPDHDGKDMELYCEVCDLVICLRCAVRGGKHYDHDYCGLDEAFEKYKEALQVVIQESLAQIDTRRAEISKQQVSIEKLIDLKIIKKGHKETELVSQFRKTELVSQLNQLTQTKLKSLAAQRDFVETIQAQLSSCLYSVSEASIGDKLIVMGSRIKQMKVFFTALKSLRLEPANLMFVKALIYTSSGVVHGLVSAGLPPFKCHVSKKAFIGENTSATLESLSFDYRPCVIPTYTIRASLIIHGETLLPDCRVEKVGMNLYKISYQPIRTGLHHLHIKVEGLHVRGSPFPIMVTSPTWTFFSREMSPEGIAVNKMEEIVVASWDEHHVTACV